MISGNVLLFKDIKISLGLLTTARKMHAQFRENRYLEMSKTTNNLYILAWTSMFTASDDISIEDAYLSCLSLIFRHWLTNRLSTIPCARKIIESCLVRLTVKAKTILKRGGIFIPTSEYMKHHIFELRRKI